MKRICLFILLVAGSLSVRAQFDPQYDYNKFNRLTINPGIAGSAGVRRVSATAIYGDKWMGVEGSPTTTAASAHVGFRLFGMRSGAGLTVLTDNIGFLQTTNIKVSYAIHRKVWGGTLGIGASAGFLQLSFADADWYVATADNSGVYKIENLGSGSELGLGDGLESGKIALDMGLGAYYRSGDFYLGTSILHLHQPQFDFSGKETASVFPTLKRHYYLEGGYRLNLPWPLFELEPCALVKFDGTSVQFTATGFVHYNRRIWGGLAYSWNDSPVLLGGLELRNGIKFGGAYGLPIGNKVAFRSSGSFEMVLNYSFSIGSGEVKRYKSVRFLY